MKRWLVKEKKTGWYLPEPKGRSGRGGSHVEPNQDENVARMFITKRAATNYLSMYCRGKFGASRYGHRDDYEEEIFIYKDTQRDREDFEIIELEIILP